MNGAKVKKAKLPGGQKNIASFFSLQNQKDLSTSTKFSVFASALKTDPTVKDVGRPPLQLHTPSKKNILRDIENQPSSPTDLFFVPETPNSQDRPPHPLCEGEAGVQGSGDKLLFTKLGQLSPICRSSRSEGVSKLNTKEGRRTVRESGFCGPLKRLLSPPEESQKAKRSNSVITLSPRISSPSGKSLKPPRSGMCVEKTLHASSDKFNESQEHSRGAEATFNHGRNTVMQPNIVTQHCPEEKQMSTEDKRISGFSAVTEQEASEMKSKCNRHSPVEPIAEVGARTPMKAQVGTSDNCKKETTRPAGEAGDKRPTSDKQRPGENTRLATECPVEENFDESWFAEQMDDNASSVTKDICRKPRKVPDHVILSGGVNNRYWVVDVEEEPAKKTLSITCSKTLHPTETCLLKDGWEMTPVSCGDVVHLEGHCDGGCWLVDKEQGFLVLLPDSLVSGTSISSSIRCMRRAVLGDMFKSFDGGSKQMLNGTMVHEVFQRAAQAKDFSLEKLSVFSDEALRSPRYLADMYSLGVCQEEMRQELQNYLPSLEHWARDYLSSPVPKALTLKISSRSNSRAPVKRPEMASVVTITELADIEDNVWAPRFGLKGKIDLTARVKIQRPRNGSHRYSEEKIFPLELKTGRESNSIEHRSQVILYTLMSQERYNAEAGFLLYLKTGNMHPVVPSHMDRRELIKLRNTLVHYLHNCVRKEAGRSCLSTFPDILTDRQTCRYCPQRLNCALYERALDSGSADVYEDAVRDFLQEETGHLTLPHLKYFSHWLLLCCLESTTMEAKNKRKHVWLQSPEESEKCGSCVGNLQLKGPVIMQSESHYLHHFLQTGAASRPSFTNIGLASGDRIVVSDQEGRLVGLTTGYLCEVSSMSVSCTLDRDLSKFGDLLFRVDGDEGVVGLSTHLNNLSRLMTNSQDSDRLRKLVVDLQAPEFISDLSSVLPREVKNIVAEILKGLNKPQKQAMKRVLLSKDYTLIVGMPGTGKTTTICTLVRILHACGFSVLLTSYTHSAVDNILLKLKRFRVGFLRLGQGQKIHPEILPYAEENVRQNKVHTLCELEQLYNKELVVATTCMGIKHPIFTRRQFDFCIIDEASQISQPICLGPLFYAKRFVLVGDHQQLPPIVQNHEARSLGMDESLFKRLELHSEAVVQLNVQYRMNRQIMSLSNSLMYDGRLECGSERTATALLTLPFLLSVQSELTSYSQIHPQHDLTWIRATLLPSNSVCFLDCSMVPALESVEQGGISNPTEAALIHMLLSFLIRAGCKPGDIGVIAPYRQQLKSISALLQSSAFVGVEVNTVDRYQGRDKSLIILSFVRSNAEEGILGELLKDWRRLNVAITRAKHKLLMVGSAATLRRYTPVEKLLNHLHQENMIIQLPPAAHQLLPGTRL